MGTAEFDASSDERNGERPELLPGEVPASSLPEDAEVWMAVYSELLDFLTTHPEAEILHANIERYSQRLSFWQQRWDELSGT